jgi:hypothetical protein
VTPLPDLLEIGGAGGVFLSLVDAPRGCYDALVIFFTAAALVKSFFPGADITITIRFVLPPQPPR